MSAEVQPRKRKDKKKRKDEDLPGALLSNEENVNIHVHKDGGTGGNICEKIVFFFLFTALIFLIGLIIKENQGLNDLENIEAESRFSQIFEGWIDKGTDDHEEDHSPQLHHEDEDEDEDDNEHYESEESNMADDTEEEQSQELDEEQDVTPESDEEASNEDTEEVRQSEETNEDNEADKSNEDDEQSDEKDQDDAETEESVEENDTAKESDEISKESQSEERVKRDVSKEDIEKVIEEEAKLKEQQEESVSKEPEQTNKESSGLPTKIGVGLALLTVAYNVFLRKRRPDVNQPPITSTSEEKDVTPNLSRRNTIVPPPTLQEVEPDLPEIEIEEEEYSEDEYSDEDSRSDHLSPREEYQELRTTYTRSLTPEGDFDVKNKKYEQEVLHDEIEEEEIEPEEDLEDIDYDKYDDDDDEDEELLKRLEAKYGKLGRDVNVGEDLQSDSDREDYEHSDITNVDDYVIKEDIDAAQQQLEKNAAYANTMFEALLVKYPLSPRSLYGKARALDILAEQQQSNELLNESLEHYLKVLNCLGVPNQLFISASERYINRARFLGQYRNSIAVHWQLIERFPDNATYLNNLAVTYLTVNLVEEARSVLKRVLSKWPEDGFALVHYGFILKTTDNNLADSIDYMSKGLKTRAPGVIDGRFYFHLGDALARLNRNEEAQKLYEEGVKEKVFLSKYQRSLYNVNRLKGKPWWKRTDLPSYEKFFSALTDNWQIIKEEGLSALNDQGYFRDEAENLKDTGTWKQLELFARGQKFTKNCEKSPVTCSIIQRFPEASSCKRGQTKFSVIHPGTHVWPHCGPTNCRLRVHLGLKIPPKTFIRVAEETRTWKEGDIIIFDDSFEHEVWHNGSDFRLVLIVDIWHPNLTPKEKQSLSPI